jgi:hypothetical protein
LLSLVNCFTCKITFEFFNAQLLVFVLFVELIKKFHLWFLEEMQLQKRCPCAIDLGEINVSLSACIILVGSFETGNQVFQYFRHCGLARARRAHGEDVQL